MSQEHIDHDLRVLIGDLQVQLLFARDKIRELEQQISRQNMQLMAMGKARARTDAMTQPVIDDVPANQES